MQCFISQKTLKKQTKLLIKNWDSPLKSIAARKILTHLYGYVTPHHYSKITALSDGSSQTISKNFFRQNLDYFIKRLALAGNIPHLRSLSLLRLLWPDYIPEKGNFPHNASILFRGILNDFLFNDQKSEPVNYSFNGFPSIKDAIEACGIPHPEVGMVEANQQSVDFSYQLQPGDNVIVHPMVDPAVKRRFPFIPKNGLRFVIDVHLGTLAKYLRMAGFDTVYQPEDQGDARLAQIAENDERILFSRDIGLLKRSNVTYGYWVRNTDPLKQFEEVILRYGMARDFTPFTRCISCNGLTEPRSVSEIKQRNDVPVNITNEYKEFKVCCSCNKVYWKGSHYDKMGEFLNRFLNNGQ